MSIEECIDIIKKDIQISRPSLAECDCEGCSAYRLMFQVLSKVNDEFRNNAVIQMLIEEKK